MESEKEEEENDDDKPPPLPTSPLPKDPELPVPATERLLGQPATAPAPATSTFVTTRYEERVDGEDDIPPLPVELEQVNPALFLCAPFCPNRKMFTFS